GSFFLDLSQGTSNFIVSAAFTVTTATLTLVPIEGPGGTVITLSGSGYAHSTSYTFCLTTSATSPCASGASFTSSASGAIPSGTTFTVPLATTPGSWFLDTSQGASNFIVSASFTVTTASLTLVPTSGPPGTIASVTGAGYAPSTTYLICLGTGAATACPGATTTTFTTTALGDIPNGTTFTIPTSTAGSYFLDVSQGSSFVISAAFAVTTAILSLTPSSGPTNSLVTLSGSGFAPSTTYLYCFQGTATSCPGATITSFTTSGTGAIPGGTTISAPATSNAWVDVTQLTSNIASAAFTQTTASVSLAPSSGPSGSLVTLSGSGFAPSTSYAYCFAASGTSPCPSATLTTFTSSGTGAIPSGTTITVPSSANGFVDVSQGNSGTNLIVSASFALTTATLTNTPSSGPDGTQITLTGSGFAPSITYTYCLSTSPSAPCASGATFTSTSGGAIPSGTTLDVPISIAPGTHYSDLSQGPSNFIISALFGVTTASLSLTPASGPPGSLVTLSGSGLAPSTTYDYCFGSSGTSACSSGSATFVSTASGLVPASTTITAPATANAFVDVSQGTASANFIVSAAFTPTTASLSITPSTGPAGTLVALTGSGFAPSTTYLECLQATSASCASGPTFTSTGTGTIPAGTFFSVALSQAAGTFDLDLSQGSGAANFIVSATFTVTTATLVLTPSSGPINTLVTLSGSGYAPSTTYADCFASSGTAASPGATTTSFTATALGAIPSGITLSVPSSGNGFVDLSQGTSTNFILSAAFTVTSVTLTPLPTSGPANSLVTLSGTGYAPSTAYTVCLSSSAT
ncbi:MAG TPA: hypothetical protein VGS18_05615, partial [Thermoplasmata archaeon]|nr:hypothetical protein [Thermoplasmata archaeon]